MIINSHRLIACTVLLLLTMVDCTTSQAATSKPNPLFVYFYNGQTIGNWGLTLGDQSNWNLPVTNNQGESADHQLSMQPTTFKGSNDAIELDWSRKKGTGQFAIYGPPIDLHAIEHRAALTLEVKVIERPKKSVALRMDCGYPCKGEIHIQKMLRGLPINKWTTVPIPLDCFSAKGLDPSKINGPLVLSTDGHLQLGVANIRMELLPKGAKTCQT